MARTRSDVFQGQLDRGLIYWPNHSMETRLSKEEEEEEEGALPDNKDLLSKGLSSILGGLPLLLM